MSEIRPDLKPTIAALAANGWAEQDKKLRKDYKFADFRDAFAFMTRCALEIEKKDHHPEWFNVYNKITVAWTTHDAGGITSRDVEMASLMDKIAVRFITKG